MRMRAAGNTWVTLSSGSPMPMKTTLVILRLRLGSASSALVATHIWEMISQFSRLRLKPCLPVAQKLQSSAQPTCEEMHRVPRSFSGMKTVSTKLCRSTSSSHLMVPSADFCSATMRGVRMRAICLSFSRSALEMSVMASKSATPR